MLACSIVALLLLAPFAPRGLAQQTDPTAETRRSAEGAEGAEEETVGSESPSGSSSALPRALRVSAVTSKIAQVQDPVPADVRLAAPATWEFSGSVFYSDPPGSEDRLTPILYADRGALHLEARYNYEDLGTLSVFGGWTIATGATEEGALEASLTPMLGVVTGDTDGLAPGLEFDLGWRDFAWYGESEYLFDRDDSDDDFFYSWSTLTYGFTDWLAAGLVVERSKLVDTDWSLQRGLALELGRGSLGLSLYAYNLGSDDSYAVVALGLAP